MRQPTAKQRPRKSEFTSFPAPTGGLVSNRNLAMARQPGAPPGAAVLNDFFPTATGVSLRRGNVRKASIVADDTVKAIFSYVTGGTTELFAAVSTGIRDITSVATPSVFAGPDVLTGQTSGNWNVVQFSTPGGSFLVGVNGVDDAFLYDGTTFTATTITFPAPYTQTTADLSYVWVYKERIWFIEKNSLNAWYLPVDSIGGELALWPMGGVFTRGGILLWGQAWSLDSGIAGGLSEQCVFTTTEGEIAAYQGLSPEVDQGWEKVAIYRVGRPLGDKAFMRAGGDLVIATTVGFISLSSAARQDYAALGQNAVSYPIEDDWAIAVADRGQVDWRCEVWPDEQMAIISPPKLSTGVPIAFVINVNTGKWCKFTGWDVRSMGLSGSSLYFGTTAGTVQQAFVTGADEGTPYFGQCLPLFDNLDMPGMMKIAKTARAVVRSTFQIEAQLSGHSNFVVNFPSPPNLGIPASGDVWDVGLWDSALWDSERGEIVTAEWVPVGAYGHDLSIGCQMTSGATLPVDAELIRIDLVFQIAGMGT